MLRGATPGSVACGRTWTQQTSSGRDHEEAAVMTARHAESVTAGGIRIGLSNLSKVLFPDDDITKGDLVEYYRDVAGRVLPYLSERPIVMARYPDGLAGQRVFQKNVPGYFPDWVSRAEVKKAGGSLNQAARPAYTAVDEFPKLLAALGASTGIPKTARVTRTPATTVSAATTAVAAPPAHSRRPFANRPDHVHIGGYHMEPPARLGSTTLQGYGYRNRPHPQTG